MGGEKTYFLSDLETGQTSHIAELLLRLNTWQTGLDESLVIDSNLVEQDCSKDKNIQKQSVKVQ